MLDAESVRDRTQVWPIKKKNECNDNAVARAAIESSLEWKIPAGRRHALLMRPQSRLRH
jgi:hypothetical protein